MFELEVSSWWCCLGKFRRRDLGGESMSLVFEVSKAQLFPDHFLLPACTLSCELFWAEGMDQQLIVLTADQEALALSSVLRTPAVTRKHL